MNRSITQALSILSALCLASGVLRAQTPTADDILRAARNNPMGEHAKLDARLRTEDDEKTPFTITLDKGVVTYDFNNPDQDIILQLGQDSSDLKERVGGHTAEVKAARYDQKVRGTPITYEDLALRLLYWPHPKLLGSDVIRTRPSWKIQVQAPKGQSQYGVALLWIDKESGAVLRIEGYDTQGRLMKRFEVIDAQKIDGVWMLRTMRVESIQPGTHHVTDRTYLEVTGKSKG
jgi:hypothetical protein